MLIKVGKTLSQRYAHDNMTRAQKVTPQSEKVDKSKQDALSAAHTR